MAAEIHSIAAVVDRLGDSTDLSVGFEHDGFDVGAAQQFERGRQSRRSGTGDDGDLHNRTRRQS